MRCLSTISRLTYALSVLSSVVENEIMNAAHGDLVVVYVRVRDEVLLGVFPRSARWTCNMVGRDRRVEG